MKEFDENWQNANERKNPRFFIMNPVNLSKMMLFNAQFGSPAKQEIEFSQRHRALRVYRGSDGKFVFKLRVEKKEDESNSSDFGDANVLDSEVEVNPEDMVLIQKFTDVDF